jgi:hypothetical protein
MQQPACGRAGVDWTSSLRTRFNSLSQSRRFWTGPIFPAEIHANEIVLLAYSIAAINIEATYHTIVGGDYVPFEGICLSVDTALRNTLQQLQQDPRRYKLFGVYWWPVKEQLKLAGYGPDQLYMIYDEDAGI